MSKINPQNLAVVKPAPKPLKRDMLKRNVLRSYSPVVPMDDPAMNEFLQMHTWMRPAGSRSEAKFVAKYIDSIEGMFADEAGNRYIKIGTAPVIWSSHTDTVHRKPGGQKITVGDGIVSLSVRETEANCLGADCTVGVWLMRQMILRGVEGLYIFHAEEEVGGLGSQHIANNNAQLIDGYHWAIAFDRKGYRSIITHQMTRCCSDGFADALADALGGDWEKDDGGTFTDTANYTGIVPECTNISVGYFDQHTGNETTDVYFAFALLEKLCALDVHSLPVLRDPTAVNESWGDYAAWWGRGREPSYYGNDAGGKAPYSGGNSPSYSKGELEDLCFEYSDVAAMILEEMGVDVDAFHRVLDDMGYTKKYRR
jgi:hypothetical protein